MEKHVVHRDKKKVQLGTKLVISLFSAIEYRNRNFSTQFSLEIFKFDIAFKVSCKEMATLQNGVPRMETRENSKIEERGVCEL